MNFKQKNRRKSDPIGQNIITDKEIKIANRVRLSVTLVLEDLHSSQMKKPLHRRHEEE
jgi:hypothetical protein